MERDGNGFLTAVNVRKTYDHKHLVVKDFNICVEQGEFITLLGPSGSGKTTVLMMLAGFESVTSGDIRVDGASFLNRPPHKRDIGMVFQNYALFPNMTVAENLAYPLEVRKMKAADVRARVSHFLKMIELQDFGARYPNQLSGGQKQRVALARSLIFEPKLVLMDEPLGALDKKLREQMQFEITSIHKKLGFTVVYVTHDQVEALTMSSRIAVFNQGVVQQYASPTELYERPANAFVADFIGENNLISGRVASIDAGVATVELSGQTVIRAQVGDALGPGQSCFVSVRPEKLTLGGERDGCENRIRARLVASHYVGDFIRHYLELEGGTQLIVKELSDIHQQPYPEGTLLDVSWHVQGCFAFSIQ
ncbi:ABC transporter ATP-binding protein [Castellaniella caeni]|uniref:ABC transporter ATP-binding protein n=1 Tax=Castellaniella caeni TaxID=266123 RepID=UPI00082F0E1B|nr:ABC transporter ATP-binding protein [Castellaniella caeni]